MNSQVLLQIEGTLLNYVLLEYILFFLEKRHLKLRDNGSSNYLEERLYQIQFVCAEILIFVNQIIKD